jgi:hypothetical protein
MPRLSYVVLLSVGLACLPIASAAQRATVSAPVIPPVVHAAPAMGPRAAVAPHVPHIAARPSVRPGTRAAANSVKAPARSASSATPAPKTSWHAPVSASTETSHTNDITTIGSGVIVHTNGPFLPTYPPQVPNAPVLLPGNIF